MLDDVLLSYGVAKEFWSAGEVNWSNNLELALQDFGDSSTTDLISQALKDRLLINKDWGMSFAVFIGDGIAEAGGSPEISYLAYEAALYEKREPELFCELGYIFLQRCRVEDLPASEQDLSWLEPSDQLGFTSYLEGRLIKLDEPGPECLDKDKLLRLAVKAFGLAWLTFAQVDQTLPHEPFLQYVRGVIALDGLRAAFSRLGDIDGTKACCQTYFESLHWDLEDTGLLMEARFKESLAFARGVEFATRTFSKNPAETNQTPKLTLDVETIRTIVSSIALRQMRQERLLDDRLPPTTAELRKQLSQRLESIWPELPARVMSHLVLAERRYLTSDFDESKIAFCKAVEAAFNHWFVEPLLRVLPESRADRVNVPFTQGVRSLTRAQIEKMNLFQWGDALPLLVDRSNRSLMSLAGTEIREFISNHHGGLKETDVERMSASLRSIQELRSGSSHDIDAATRFEREEAELMRLREIVLPAVGISVVVEIYRCFGDKT